MKFANFIQFYSILFTGVLSTDPRGGPPEPEEKRRTPTVQVAQKAQPAAWVRVNEHKRA